MIGLIRSLVTWVEEYLMRREQYENVKLRSYFAAKYDVDVGLYSYGCFDRWRMPGPIRVGRYCSFAKTVRSAPDNHPTDALTTHPVLYDPGLGVVDRGRESPSPLIVEDDVWVGHNVMILPSCKFIGRGAVIGAGSVVVRDVERYTIVAGNPARKLRDRFSAELAAAIEESRWWELAPADLRGLIASRPEVVFAPSVAAIEAWLRVARR